MRESHPIIAIDGLIFQASLVGGISRVWLSLFQEWAKTDFGRHLLILSRGNTAPIIPSLNYCVIPPSPNDYDREEMEKDRQLLQQICDAEGVSLFVSTYYSTPLSTPSVCLLHDMIPEVLQADLTQLVWQEKHQAIRQALSYITVSQNTANDLIKFFPQIPVEKITVAHCGVDKIFKPATYSQIDRFRDKYQIAKPYYLLVGDNRGYKRYLYFFEAFAQLDNHQEFDIVWIGNTLPISPEIQEFMSASTLYSLHVDDDELVSAYSGAIALVYPSIYEGFGLPLLEAIACGCPVITCYNSSIPEVVSDAALFIEATQISSFVEALIKVQDSRIRDALIERGIEHSQHFSWEKMANTLKANFLQAIQKFATLDDNNLENSFIIFPDWTQPLETLYPELKSVVQNIMMTENCDCFTLLIEVNDADSSLANEILSEVVMSLLMEPDLAFEAEPYISFISVSKLSHIQKQVLANKIRACIEMEHEDQKAIIASGMNTIPACKVDELHSLITSLQIGQLNKDLAPISNNLSKEYRVGKYNILLPLDHKLDAYQAKWKRYDLALGYIAQSVFLKYPNSSAIDIGANVGDTAALIRKHVNVPVLCVEGNPQFIEYLRHNTSKIDNITIDVCFIGEDGKSVRAENIVSHSGTASIANSSDIDNNSIDDEIQMKSLKTLISDNLGFSNSKLLKIDTDGYDFLIINESIQTISEFLPVIYFEYDITFQNDGADQGFNTVRRLFDIGYESLIIYDNFGNYLTSISSQQADQRINQFLDVHTYLISNRQISVSPAIFYFDICAFPARDKDIFERIRKMEINQDEILTAN